MAVAPEFIAGLLDAAHAFLDAPDLSSLTRSVESRTADLLGCLEARLVIPEPATGASAVTSDLAAALGAAPPPAASDHLRSQLEPFYSLDGPALSRADGPAAAALRALFPGREAAACTVRAGGRMHGILAACDDAKARLFTGEDLSVLSELALFAGQAIRAEEIAREREARDGLTGLYDQSYLRRELALELHRAQRRGEPLSVLMLDIDHFKAVNDSAGHAAGDDVLRRVAAFLSEHARASDLACRYGGEEFAVLLTGASEDAGMVFAQRLRTDIAQVAPGEWGAWPGTVTVSAGVAAYSGRGAQDPAELINAADRALYAAKRSGRDRACRASES